jgi:hypothetical protein
MMKLMRIAIAAALSVSLVVSSTPAEAWFIPPAAHPVSQAFPVLLSQAVNAPGDVFANAIDETRVAAVAVNRQVPRAVSHSWRGMTNPQFGVLMAVLVLAVAVVPYFWPAIGPVLAFVPWWGKGLLLLLAWIIFSPVEQVRHATHITVSEFPKDLKMMIRQFGKAPFISIANFRENSMGLKDDDLKSLFVNGITTMKDQIKSIDDLEWYAAAFDEIAKVLGGYGHLSGITELGSPMPVLMAKYGFQRPMDRQHLISAL